MKAVIFSAGFGTRLKPWTDTKAKPAIAFLDLSLIAYPLYFIKDLCDEVIINTHHLPATVEAAYSGLNTNFKTQFVNESPDILQSGGTLKSLEQQLKNQTHFLTANADVLLITKDNEVIHKMLQEHIESKAIATLLTTDLEGIGSTVSAAWVNNDDEVLSFGKNKEGKPTHYTGFMILSSQILKFLPEGVSNILIDGLLPAIAKGHKVNVYHRPDITWFETGTIKDFEDNEKLYKDNPELLKIREYYGK